MSADGVWVGSGVGEGDAATSCDSPFPPDSAVAVRVGVLVAVASGCVGVVTGVETEGAADSAAIAVCVGLGGAERSWLSSMQPVAIRRCRAAIVARSFRIQAEISIASERLKNLDKPKGL